MSLQFHTTVRNGVIELPEQVRRAISEETNFVVTLESEKRYDSENILDFLCKHPLKTDSIQPLSREEANQRE